MKRRTRMLDEDKEFVITVRRRWKLWILPVLAFLYFAAIVTLAVLRKEIAGVPMDTLVLAGLGLFALVILVELPFLFRRRIRDATPAPAPERSASETTWAPSPAAPAMRVASDDERLVTTENQQGLRVLEFSAPAKSRHRGAVYAKTYVPVTKEHVLRVETLAAEGADL